jgi:hypothetical protein
LLLLLLLLARCSAVGPLLGLARLLLLVALATSRSPAAATAAVTCSRWCYGSAADVCSRSPEHLQRMLHLLLL